MHSILLFLLQPAFADTDPMTALRPFAGDHHASGAVVAGALGEGALETPTTMAMRCTPAVEGRWLDCDVHETIGSGKQAMKLHIRFSMGWDGNVGSYRAVGLDDEPTSTFFSGRLEGAKLVFESDGSFRMQGQPMRERVTFDLFGKDIGFLHEHAVGGGEFAVFERANLAAGK